MKFRNKTDTIVLLYDAETMHGQINPGCISIEINDDIASKSPTIQKFLHKGIIEIADKNAKDEPKQRVSTDNIIKI